MKKGAKKNKMAMCYTKHTTKKQTLFSCFAEIKKGTKKENGRKK